jgi:hypothetical protein
MNSPSGDLMKNPLNLPPQAEDFGEEQKNELKLNE